MVVDMMTLDEYLWRTKQSRSEFAILVGVSRATVQAWLRFERDKVKSASAWAPARKWRRKLAKITKGAVSVDNWN